MRADTMTMTQFPGSQTGPSDEDRDTALDRVGRFPAAAAVGIHQLEAELALRDAAAEFGAALQAHVPEGLDLHHAWTLLEESFLRATRGVVDHTQHTEA